MAEVQNRSEEPPWRHSNAYNAVDKCKFCDGVTKCEDCCRTRNPLVAYAFNLAEDSSIILQADEISLHALGVTY